MSGEPPARCSRRSGLYAAFMPAWDNPARNLSRPGLSRYSLNYSSVVMPHPSMDMTMPRNERSGFFIMFDLVFLAIGLGFFGASWLYLFACDRL
jgi:hypothetical protein